MLAEKISKRYVKALFNTIENQKDLIKIEEEINIFSEQLKLNFDFKKILHSPRVSEKVKIKFLSSISEELNFSKIFTAFLIVVIKNNRLNNIEEILKEFSKQLLSHKNIKLIRVTSASGISIEEKEQIIKKFQKLEEKIIIEEKIDPEIIGGLIFEIDSKVFDGSVKNKFERLKMDSQIVINSL